MRFSRYCDHPEEYGLQLKPDILYQCCFQDHPDIVNNFGIYYDLVGGPFTETIWKDKDLYYQIHEAVTSWRKQFYAKQPPVLVMTEGYFGLIIVDTRPCAPERGRILLGLRAKIYRLAWEPVSMKTLMKRIPDRSEEEIQAELDTLISQKLMIHLSGKYLALAVLNT